MSELVGQSEQAVEQATGRKPYAAPELVVLKGDDTEGKGFIYRSEISVSVGPS